MITTYEEFEAALERLTECLNHPAAPGGPDAAEVSRLLADIDAYRPSAPAEQENPNRFSGLRARADSLAERAAEFAQARDERERRERLMDPTEEGLGPTTGAH